MGGHVQVLSAEGCGDKGGGMINELEFAFIDAVIAGDMELALKIAYDIEQGEQISFLGGE